MVCREMKNRERRHTDVPCRKLKIQRVETGETFEDDADVLIAARGALNDIAWPQIPGLRSFKGEVMHSAAWNEKYMKRRIFISHVRSTDSQSV
jgi:hypothetical protein